MDGCHHISSETTVAKPWDRRQELGTLIIAFRNFNHLLLIVEREGLKATQDNTKLYTK